MGVWDIEELWTCGTYEEFSLSACNKTDTVHIPGFNHFVQTVLPRKWSSSEPLRRTTPTSKLKSSVNCRSLSPVLGMNDHQLQRNGSPKTSVAASGTSYEGLPFSQQAARITLGHESSSSLPNLSDISSQDINSCVHMKGHVSHGSLKDVTESNSLLPYSQNGVDKLLRTGRTHSLDLEECSVCRKNENQGQSQQVKMESTVASPTEVTISVGPNNNRLSAVLENIPLVYIPHTKQLVSLSPPPQVIDPAPLSMENTSQSYQNVSAANYSSTESKSTHCPDRNSVDKANSDVETPGDLSKESNLSEEFNPNSSIMESSSSNDATIAGDTEQSCLRSEECEFSEQYRLSLLNLSSDLDDDTPTELTHMNSARQNTADVSKQFVNNDLLKGDGSSFSSVASSSGTEASGSAMSCCDAPTETDESGFVEINLGPRNTFERCSRAGSLDSGVEVKPVSSTPVNTGVKPKKRGLSGLLSRGIFSRKPKDTTQSENPQQQEDGALGWKLFGKVPPRTCPSKDPSEISEDFRSRQNPSTVMTGSSGKEKIKKSDVEAPSTTALILEQRPAGLPSKTPEEEERHRQEYEAMVEAARKKEQREARQKKKQLQKQLKYEQELAVSLSTWTNEILPSWELMSASKKTRELMWSGIPPSVRGKVWKLALGNDLNLTPELYEICANRAQDRLKLMREAAASSDTDSLSSFSNEPASCKEASVDLIRLDVSRTFPQLCIFQKGGPLNELLQGLLGAYACYRPDVGYVQGMSFIAAVLLLNMEVDDAFICFANLLNRPCQVAFFRLDENLMKCYFETYEAFFKENLPKLYDDFRKMNITPDLYIIDWMFTLYAKSLPLDVASRVWDVFCRDGEEFLFRTALGILKLYETVLLSLDFIHLVQFLTRLPENLPGDDLFKCIEKIHMTIDNRRFNQVLAGFRDAKDS